MSSEVMHGSSGMCYCYILKLLKAHSANEYDNKKKDNFVSCRSSESRVEVYCYKELIRGQTMLAMGWQKKKKR